MSHSKQASGSSSELPLARSIGISADLHLNNHILTCSNELFKIAHISKVDSVCPVVKHVAVNILTILFVNMFLQKLLHQ